MLVKEKTMEFGEEMKWFILDTIFGLNFGYLGLNFEKLIVSFSNFVRLIFFSNNL